MIPVTRFHDVSGRKAIGGESLMRWAQQRLSRGLAPPPEIYRIENRQRINWLQFPDWARPVDPELFDGCVHEG